MKCVLVSHSHWDREWYRTFQSFRARLVDLIDRVLELIAADPGYRFLLDGQTIVIEDYLEIRPGRRADLEAACRAGRLAIGPWYVQPDSLLPSGEAHVRNLLEGRRVGAAVGPVSRVAYCPDSFGHPAQLPQLFRGFGLGPFIYWRGGGDEVDSLPAAYLWTAPDGTAVLAHRLAEGYFAASGLPLDPAAAARVLAEVTRSLASAGARRIASTSRWGRGTTRPRSWRARRPPARSSASPVSAPSAARRGASRSTWRCSTPHRIRVPTSCASRRFLGAGSICVSGTRWPSTPGSRSASRPKATRWTGSRRASSSTRGRTASGSSPTSPRAPSSSWPPTCPPSAGGASGSRRRAAIPNRRTRAGRSRVRRSRSRRARTEPSPFASAIGPTAVSRASRTSATAATPMTSIPSARVR